MNKAELIAHISDEAGINKTQANMAIDAFTRAVTTTLSAGQSVTLVGFGTFSISQREARTGRNPQTKEAIQIAAKTVAKFKPGADLSKAVNPEKKAKKAADKKADKAAPKAEKKADKKDDKKADKKGGKKK